MSCSSASHSVPRVRSSAASPLPSCRPQVSPGSMLSRRKRLPLVMRKGSTYFWMRSRISRLAMVSIPSRQGAAHCPGQLFKAIAPCLICDGLSDDATLLSRHLVLLALVSLVHLRAQPFDLVLQFLRAVAFIAEQARHAPTIPD